MRILVLGGARRLVGAVGGVLVVVNERVGEQQRGALPELREPHRPRVTPPRPSSP
jgi:ABC-type branched-subunit amino acid transport system permease subunit